MLLKAELHCHIEGAAAPELVLRQAQKYGKDISAFIKDGSFVWHDFTIFLAAYDFAADLFRSEEDYAQLTEHYLTSLARDGAIYSEVFTSPDHALRPGLSPAGLHRRAWRRHGARQGQDRHRRPHDRHRSAAFRRRIDRGGGPLRRQMRPSAGHRLRHGRRRAHGRLRRLCASLRDRARGGARHHRSCRRAVRLGKRAGRARPHQAGAHRPWRARDRKPGSGQAHRR